jgi:hypothetical protein
MVFKGTVPENRYLSRPVSDRQSGPLVFNAAREADHIVLNVNSRLASGKNRDSSLLSAVR